jgi:hypothetical protein
VSALSLRSRILISSLVGVVVVVAGAEDADARQRSEDDAERAVRRRAAQVALAVDEDAERLSIIAWIRVRARCRVRER